MNPKPIDIREPEIHISKTLFSMHPKNRNTSRLQF